MPPFHMEVRKRVGQNVRKYRLELDLSQEDLAFECGLHRTYISGVERGIRNPTVLVLEQIAEALKIPSSLLLEDVPGRGLKRAHGRPKKRRLGRAHGR